MELARTYLMSAVTSTMEPNQSYLSYHIYTVYVTILKWVEFTVPLATKLRGKAGDGWEDAQMGRSAREVQSLCPGLANLSDKVKGRGKGQEGARKGKKERKNKGKEENRATRNRKTRQEKEG